MPKPVIGSQRRTHPLIWCAAIICTVFSVAVIFTGIVVFIGYLVIRPTIPIVSVTYAHLDKFDYTQAGILNTQLTIVFKAENDNIKAHASFSDFGYDLTFHGLKVATLKNHPFDVGKNETKEFSYLVSSNSIPLDPDMMDMVLSSLQQQRITFDLKGHSRTRWRVGPLGSLKFWCRLNCELQFDMNGDSIDSHCTSNSK